MNFLVYLCPVFYFCISWFFPWQLIQWDSSISITYLFDLAFVCVFYFILEPKMKLKVEIGIFIRLLITIALALICITITSSFNLSAPFKYVDNLFIQILVLAPIIEELVFRFAFYEMFKEKISNRKIQFVLNSLLFSISHSAALAVLPTEFYPFIFFQIIYTFFLGWICTKAKDLSQSIIEPIILHFVFNLFFYFAVIKGVI